MSYSNPIFTVSSEVAQSGLLKISVNAQGVPANLFGVSFHLDISGGSSGWLFDHSEEGNVFAVTPMSLVKEFLAVGGEEKSLVVGISLRRGDELLARDGTLGSFYLRAEDGVDWVDVQDGLKVDFANSVASVYENGRGDLEGVVWQGSGAVLAGDEVVAGAGDGNVGVSREGGGDGVDVLMDQRGDKSGKSLLSEVSGDSQAMILKNDNSVADIYGFLFFVFLSMMIVFVGWLVFKYRHEIRSFIGIQG